MARTDPKIPDLMESVAANLGDIVRNEVRLAKAEAGQGAADAMRGVVLLAVALLLLIPALVVIALGAVGVLVEETDLSPWTAHLLTDGVLIVLALIALAAGGKSMASRHMRLHRSIRNVGQDIKTVREAT
jgi:uncharacterized membrane protein YqjE